MLLHILLSLAGFSFLSLSIVAMSALMFFSSTPVARRWRRSSRGDSEPSLSMSSLSNIAPMFALDEWCPEVAPWRRMSRARLISASYSLGSALMSRPYVGIISPIVACQRSFSLSAHAK